MRKIKMSTNYNESELFKLFGKYARFVFDIYIIEFNNKFLSADNPKDLFEKVKNEYAEYVDRQSKMLS